MRDLTNLFGSNSSEKKAFREICNLNSSFKTISRKFTESWQFFNFICGCHFSEKGSWCLKHKASLFIGNWRFEISWKTSWFGRFWLFFGGKMWKWFSGVKDGSGEISVKSLNAKLFIWMRNCVYVKLDKHSICYLF